MLYKSSFISLSSAYWSDIASILLQQAAIFGCGAGSAQDMSGIRIVVPDFAHANLLKAALAQKINGNFIPPRIITLLNWCALLSPEADLPTAASARLMALYAELRQHGWLKKLFTARRNTDLLPLAEMLLTLSDELTQSLLPAIWADAGTAQRRWQQALDRLDPGARAIISDEAQLVWSIWKTQLDGSDALVVRYRQMMRLAEQADSPLIWISGVEPAPLEDTFLRAYAKRQAVLPILTDWNAGRIAPAAMAVAWPEICHEASVSDTDKRDIAALAHVALSPAGSLEQEAQLGAQTVIDWLQGGKNAIAIIAQDRVVTRRMRALLERAQVMVTDETGWKLSTTRAASAVAAWFDVIAARAETIVLLDLLKSPFVFAANQDKQAHLMAIETRLRHANVLGGWEAVIHALTAEPALQRLLESMMRQAMLFGGRKTLSEWSATTEAALLALGMWQALQDDAAGGQVIALLETISPDCAEHQHAFSFAEWRAFIGLQLESTSFVVPAIDRRVMILPLNSAQLRPFDAVLMVGCDAEHLPSQANETLFFANAVRRELGLDTRESRQHQQLRDFAALLSLNGDVVLSWQTHRNGEPNAVSPWVERLQLVLERAHVAPLPRHQVQIGLQDLLATLPVMPTPSAPRLLPAKLSASGYNSLLACPYQFFATRMLGLSGMDELSDMPEKRDYGDWLHKILHNYHTALRDRSVPPGERESLLRNISAEVLDAEVENNAAALGYAMRWQKVLPAYLAWANQREADGWQFAFGERKFEKMLGRDEWEITLHGRIDRIDENAAGARAVLDYKTKNATALRDKLKDGEDRQLAFYGVLSDLPVDEASYVALEAVKDKISDVEAKNFPVLTQRLAQQLGSNMQAIAQGAPLPASGIEAVCEYCSVRGLCRKGNW